MPIDDNVNPDPNASDLEAPHDSSTGDGATGDSDGADSGDDGATGD